MRFLNEMLTVGWFLLAFVAGGLLIRSTLVAPEVPVREMAGHEQPAGAPAFRVSTREVGRPNTAGLGRQYDVEPTR